MNKKEITHLFKNKISDIDIFYANASSNSEEEMALHRYTLLTSNKGESYGTLKNHEVDEYRDYLQDPQVDIVVENQGKKGIMYGCNCEYDIYLMAEKDNKVNEEGELCYSKKEYEEAINRYKQCFAALKIMHPEITIIINNIFGSRINTSIWANIFVPKENLNKEIVNNIKKYFREEFQLSDIKKFFLNNKSMKQKYSYENDLSL